MARSVLALLSGLIYCPTATAKARVLSDCLVPENRESLTKLHLDAARKGLDATTPDGLSFRALARELVEYSDATLGGKDCRWATPGDLAVVAERIG